jgi:hypothetical protein
VGYRLYGVIGAETALGTLRHPSMHPMLELRHGLGLCAVRTRAVIDEPVADAPGQLPYLTSSVLDYVEHVSQRAPVVYVTADFTAGAGEQGACGWAEGSIALGPLTTHHERPPRAARRLLRRDDTGAIDTALRWLGIPRRRGCDRFEWVGLGERRDWES